MRKITGTLVVVGVFLWGVGHAQTLSEKPNPTGGNPVGIWEAKEIPLQIYASEQLLAVVSDFTGLVSGRLTLNGKQAYQADYITTASGSGAILGIPIQFTIIDTTLEEGIYKVEGANLIMTKTGGTAAPDTLGFTAENDSLRLILQVTPEQIVQQLPEQYQQLAALVPVLAPEGFFTVLRMVKVGEPDAGPTTLSADFNQDNTVNFQDFLLFAAQFGKAVGEAGYDVAFDLNSSGAVDFPDFLDFASQFGLSK